MVHTRTGGSTNTLVEYALFSSTLYLIQLILALAFLWLSLGACVNMVLCSVLDSPYNIYDMDSSMMH